MTNCQKYRINFITYCYKKAYQIRENFPRIDLFNPWETATKINVKLLWKYDTNIIVANSWQDVMNIIVTILLLIDTIFVAILWQFATKTPCQKLVYSHGIQPCLWTSFYL